MSNFTLLQQLQEQPQPEAPKPSPMIYDSFELVVESQPITLYVPKKEITAFDNAILDMPNLTLEKMKPLFRQHRVLIEYRK